MVNPNEHRSWTQMMAPLAISNIKGHNTRTVKVTVPKFNFSNYMFYEGNDCQKWKDSYLLYHFFKMCLKKVNICCILCVRWNLNRS